MSSNRKDADKKLVSAESQIQKDLAQLEKLSFENAVKFAKNGDLLGFVKLARLKLFDKKFHKYSLQGITQGRFGGPSQRQVICLYAIIALLTADKEYAATKYNLSIPTIESLHHEALNFLTACVNKNKLGTHQNAPDLSSDYFSLANLFLIIASKQPTIGRFMKRIPDQDPISIQLAILALLNASTTKNFYEYFTAQETQLRGEDYQLHIAMCEDAFSNYLTGLSNLQIFDKDFTSEIAEGNFNDTVTNYMRYYVTAYAEDLTKMYEAKLAEARSTVPKEHDQKAFFDKQESSPQQVQQKVQKNETPEQPPRKKSK